MVPVDTMGKLSGSDVRLGSQAQLRPSHEVLGQALGPSPLSSTSLAQANNQMRSMSNPGGELSTVSDV